MAILSSTLASLVKKLKSDTCSPGQIVSLTKSGAHRVNLRSCERLQSHQKLSHLSPDYIVTCQPIVGLRSRALLGSRPVNKSSAQPR
jgi:hypothetical protein